MADYTRSAHLALLARAKAALAPHAASAGISDLIADLEAAVGRIQQTPVPWPVPVYLALIGHGHGTSVAAAVSHKGLLDQVAVFCRSQWGEINDDRDPASLDASLVVRDYFNRHPEDRLVSRMDWIEPDIGYDPERLEIGNYLALSSRHISWPTTLTIDEWMTRDPSDRPVSIADTHYGWLICTVPSSFGDRSAIPDDLTDTLSFAQEKGCDYLILDRDASTTDRLPCFEW
ncbi:MULTISPECIES: hypothetical protein [Sphingomonadaceae]|jgi:hypothetical protein|uniref:DUF5983 family protein n=1 Tax=Sphingomonadales TaxID=204457 RepID=UPI000A3AB20F|nr:hypothetical protein [Sphingobium sp. GW456-12-10-14-TSB1]OUC53011.1 hypothetical protein CA262_20760 [Sphingobium sp. GW456-12-10-14-TSB1]